jgi:hypothetical protein
MQFDPALAARASFSAAEAELGPEWPVAVELEELFSSSAGPQASGAYEALLDLGRRHPRAYAFHAFCIYITWQQVTEETIARHFETGVRLCERYLASPEGRTPEDSARIRELYDSFMAGLGLEEEDDLQTEFKRDIPKGGD